MGLIAKLNKIGNKPSEMWFGGFLGSHAAWGQLGGVLGDLDVEKHYESVHLWEHGCAGELIKLERQLKDVAGNVEGPAAEFLGNLLSALEDRGDAEVIAICDEYAEG